MRRNGSTNRARVLATAVLMSSLTAGCVSGGNSYSNRGLTADAGSIAPISVDPNAPQPPTEMPPNVLTVPGLPVPKEAQVILSDTVIVGDDDKWTGQIVMMTEGFQPVQIVEYMRLHMPSYGWRETAIVRSRRTSITYVQGPRFATVRILPFENGAEIDIIVSPALKMEEGRLAQYGTTNETYAPQVPSSTVPESNIVVEPLPLQPAPALE